MPTRIPPPRTKAEKNRPNTDPIFRLFAKPQNLYKQTVEIAAVDDYFICGRRKRSFTEAFRALCFI